MLVAWMVSGVRIADGKSALIAALVLGVANIVVRPVIVFLTLPLTMITLGLFLIVVNAGMLMLTSGLVSGFKVDNFRSAVIGSVVLSLLNLGVNMVFGI